MVFWELFQQLRIEQARLEAGSAKSHAKRARYSAAEVEERLDQLSLVCRAMWEMLSEKTGMTEEALSARVEEVDLRDGVRDGRLRKEGPDLPRMPAPQPQSAPALSLLRP
ncbi:MAG TPA: hypothetical protein VGC54_14190 [Planctomycetota bacterium]